MVPFSLILHCTQLCGSKQRKHFFHLHLANKNLEVDNLCPLWQTKRGVYVQDARFPLLPQQNPNFTGCSYTVSYKPFFPASPAAWAAFLPSFGQGDMSRHGDSEVALDFLIKGSTFGYSALSLFPTSEQSRCLRYSGHEAVKCRPERSQRASPITIHPLNCSRSQLPSWSLIRRENEKPICLMPCYLKLNMPGLILPSLG